MSLSRDERGPYLAVGFERVEAVRAALLAAGVPFQEDPPEGCTGPVYAVLRFPEGVDPVAVGRALEDSGGA